MVKVSRMTGRTGGIEIVFGDITQQKVDAIVNAANSTLLGGGGVDGAIHHAAGPQLLEECRQLGGCPTGEAKITKGYRLPAKYVIHTVGPVWRGGDHREDELLRNCYVNVMRLAAEKNVKTIAFPSISTGAYGFPIKRASNIAVTTVIRNLEKSEGLQVIFVCFSKDDYVIYQHELARLRES
jgi:O-acetyl-ADP-ribose deacetylase (regulator of RNase III)